MTNIKITVKLFAQYREGNFKVAYMFFEHNTQVAEVIKYIGLDIQKYPIGILIVNGRHVDDGHVLQENDTLGIFPKVGGG